MSRSADDISYGVLLRRQSLSLAELVAEEIETLGFSIVESHLPTKRVTDLRQTAVTLLDRPEDTEDPNIVRGPWAMNGSFAELIHEPLVLDVLRRLIPGRIVLNQQNLVRSPGGQQAYSQARWHRDLPYQHFVSTRPLAINVLLCLDEFTKANGGTAILPATHKEEKFPSDSFARKHTLVAEVPQGSLIFLNGMTYHKGRANETAVDRIGVNHVYSSPILKQQLDHESLATEQTRTYLTAQDLDLLDIPTA
jgi:ectoine hydroxylase-related dioxygenase (phytanoyl-CoA dioxygenase family)